jgi:hypothetical protein
MGDMTLISDIVTRLITLGYGTALGTDIFSYLFPPEPLNCIWIKDGISARVPSEEMGGDGIDYPGFQIQVRNTDIQTAHDDAEVIRLALNGITVGEYSIFTTRSDPQDVTSPEDLQATNGPVWRFAIDFETIKVR